MAKKIVEATPDRVALEYLEQTNPHTPIKDQGVSAIQALDLGWYMSAETDPATAMGPREDMVNLYEATPHEVRVVMRQLWTELLDDGLTQGEFERRYPLAKAQKETGGPDLDWYDNLDVEGRFNRLLQAVRTRHTISTGKTHDPTGYYWVEDDDNPAKIERFHRDVQPLGGEQPRHTYEVWRDENPEQLREEWR